MRLSEQSADLLSPGTMVAGRYRLVCPLGRGGMGQVYRAEDLRLGQLVALKFLAMNRDQDPVQRRSFLDEARFARQVSHAHVCRVYDVGEAEGRLFLSMEHIEGEDLRTLLERSGRMPRERATQVALQICRGLAAIHERGLLHRDLKPANVMIDSGGQARLTDFGLAAPADSMSSDPPFAGTLAYMSPEQILGEPATMRSDLYALGLVTYELFTGRRLYPKPALNVLARRLGGDEPGTQPLPEVELEADLDPHVARVVRWCLATNPRERPASAEAVEAALLPDAGQEPGTVLKTLVVASDPSSGRGHEQRQRNLLAEYGGREAAAVQGPVWLFERPWGAVCFALAWRQAVAAGVGAVRIGIHLGEVILRRQGPGPLRAGGPEVDRARRLAEMARPGQTLLSELAFDLARRHSVSEAAPEATVRWLSHGRYRLSEREETDEVFEVGFEGSAPLVAPESSTQARAVAEGFLPGWRPAPGAAIPQRPGWRIERQLGEGGFGDVWLAREAKTREPRVFKFCYDLARLRALQREITIFRLLKEELGERPDITRVVDWSFDEAPYFIESAHTVGGSLSEWAQGQGGLDRVPLAARLAIVAQVATALAAAHSVGVLHKDVKPGNILIAAGENGEVEAQLCDFGLGVITDRDRLAAAKISAMTEVAMPAAGSLTGGTRLYLAPELLEGKPPTVQTDIYSLGLVLYQMVVGDLSRALAPGWPRDIGDELLREDIAAAVDGSPGRRLANAAELAERLRALPARRAAREAERRARQRAERALRQRRILAAALVAFAVFAALAGGMAWRVAREARRAEREAAAAREVSQLLVGMFEIADPFATAPGETPGGIATARDILDRGARKLDTELQDQPEIRARLMRSLGRVYERLAFHDEALALYEKALALRREKLGAEHPDVAASLHDLAWVLYLKGDHPRAEALLRETLALRKKHLGDEHLDVANCLHDLAWVLQAKGDLDAAERYSREALAMKRRLLPDPDRDRSLAATLNHLSFLLQSKGDPAAAEPLAREALAMTRRLWGEHPDVAESLNNLARVLLAKGDPAGAEAPAREALAMRRRLLGDEHPAVAQSLHDLATMLAAQRKYAAAEPLFQQSLAMYRRLQGDRQPGTAMARRSLADLYAAWGKAPSWAGPRFTSPKTAAAAR